MIDRRVFLVVVVTLGVTLLVTVVAVAALAGSGRNVPGVLEQLATALVTGLLGLLVRSPAAEPQPVNVVNSASAPVPVEQTP